MARRRSEAQQQRQRVVANVAWRNLALKLLEIIMRTNRAEKYIIGRRR